jgi:hypothetical protein
LDPFGRPFPCTTRGSSTCGAPRIPKSRTGLRSNHRISSIRRIFDELHVTLILCPRPSSKCHIATSTSRRRLKRRSGHSSRQDHTTPPTTPERVQRRRAWYNRVRAAPLALSCPRTKRRQAGIDRRRAKKKKVWVIRRRGDGKAWWERSRRPWTGTDSEKTSRHMGALSDLVMPSVNSCHYCRYCRDWWGKSPEMSGRPSQTLCT